MGERIRCLRSKPAYFVNFLAEVLGTALLMFLGCMGCIQNYDDPKPPHHLGGLAFGLTVLVIIQLLGHVSGAHLNPAVTIATVLFRILTPSMGVVYIIAQFIGAIIGYGALKLCLPDYYVPDGFCATYLDSKVGPVQGLFIEIICTTVLIMVCCAVWDKRNVDKDDSTPLRFGLIVALLSMVAGPYTGCSMNTARSLAPMVYGGVWDYHWIFWVGPNIAPFLGCGIYRIIFAEEDEEIEEEQKLSKEQIFLENTQLKNGEKV